jgi:hypothetical protein
VYKVLVGKPEGKRPLGRPRRRWEDGIRMDLREIDLGARWANLIYYKVTLLTEIIIMKKNKIFQFSLISTNFYVSKFFCSFV